jgi:hypothetical protein
MKEWIKRPGFMVAVVAVLASVALIAAACGSDEGDGGATAEPPPGATAAPPPGAASGCNGRAYSGTSSPGSAGRYDGHDSGVHPYRCRPDHR